MSANHQRERTRPRDPLDPDFLRRAEQIASQYRLILQVDDRGTYRGSALEMPRVFDHGTTPDECVRRMREALTVTVAALLEAGKTPPLPLRQARRDEQINVRVSAEEKVLLEAAARQSGFRSVSDYIRRRAIEGAA